MTRAERERRLLLIRQDLIDMRNSYPRELIEWLQPPDRVRFIEAIIQKVDALLSAERKVVE